MLKPLREKTRAMTHPCETGRRGGSYCVGWTTLSTPPIGRRRPPTRMP